MIGHLIVTVDEEANGFLQMNANVLVNVRVGFLCSAIEFWFLKKVG